MNRSVRRRLEAVGVWPVLLTACDCIVWKLQLFSVAILHLLFSSDKQWLRRAPENQVKKQDEPLVTKSKRVLFVRHAASEWNEVFNRGLNLHALVRLLRAIVREWLLLPSGDSVFLDSPLSRRGRFQAQGLQEQVCGASLDVLEGGVVVTHQHAHGSRETQEQMLLNYICCPMPGSVVVASNLRRAIDTARIASATRLELPGERIYVLSCLQEIGRNFDTLAISQPHAIQPHEVLVQAPRGEKQHDELFNVSESHGNKAILGSGRDRLLTFAQWVFRQQKEVVVVYGHSLWFRAFCREFFPSDVQHEAKSAKMSNCGVVTFMLQERSGGGGDAAEYSIDPDSFQHLI